MAGRAIANPGFEFNPYLVDPDKPFRLTPHADDCDGSCEVFIPDVLYSCRTPGNSDGSQSESSDP